MQLTARFLGRICLGVAALAAQQADAQQHEYDPPKDVEPASADELDAVFPQTWDLFWATPLESEFERLASVIEVTGIEHNDPYLQARGLARRAWADIRTQHWERPIIKKLDIARQLTASPPQSPERRAAYAAARAEVLLIDGCLKTLYRIRKANTESEDIEEGLMLSWETADDSLLCAAHIIAYVSNSHRESKIPALFNAMRAEHYAERTNSVVLKQFARRFIISGHVQLRLVGTESFNQLCDKTLQEFPPDSPPCLLIKQHRRSKSEIDDATERYLSALAEGKLPPDFEGEMLMLILESHLPAGEITEELLLLVELAILEMVEGQNLFAAMHFRSLRGQVLLHLGRTKECLEYIEPLYREFMKQKKYLVAKNLSTLGVECCNRDFLDLLPLWKQHQKAAEASYSEMMIPEITATAKAAMLQENASRRFRRLERDASKAAEAAIRLEKETATELANESLELEKAHTRGILLAAFLLTTILIGTTAVIIVRNQALRTRQGEMEAEIQQRIAAESALMEAQAERGRQQRLHVLGEIAAGVAHDVNNCLSPIGIYSELLLESGAASFPEDEFSGVIKSINQCVNDAAGLIRRLHPFHRKSFSEHAEVDVPAVLKWVAENEERRVHSRNISVVLETEPGTFHMSPSDLREILVNLVNNATDSISETGVVVLRNRFEQHHVVLEVEDNGSGMNEDTRSKCLEAFFSTKTDTGSGLGLATTRAVVQSYEGTIELKSELGKGTIFQVRLPLLGLGQETPPKRGRTSETRLPALRVLLVDDDPHTSSSTKHLLEHLGHEVNTCEPTEVTQLLNDEHFDVLLTDYKMPEMTGYEICKQVRPLFPDLVLVITSGFEEPGISEACDAFLPKPISMETLKKTLLESYRSHNSKP